MVTPTPSTQIFSYEDLRFMEYPHWDHICFAFNELKEYAAGVKLTKELLPQVQAIKDTIKPDYEALERLNDIINNLWLSRLHFLDYSDDWYGYIETFDCLKKNRLEVFQGIYLDQYQTTYKRIQKKIERLEAGKNVKHLRHKQSHDLLDDEYERKMQYVERCVLAGEQELASREVYIKLNEEAAQKESEEIYQEHKELFDAFRKLSEQDQEIYARILAPYFVKVVIKLGIN